ncbi:hypothetical protein MX103_14095, partial [Pseudomonas aeruginosa]|nr:hypothetical protein [Pseudomonas aeruginosa]
RVGGEGGKGDAAKTAAPSAPAPQEEPQATPIEA